MQIAHLADVHLTGADCKLLTKMHRVTVSQSKGERNEKGYKCHALDGSVETTI